MRLVCYKKSIVMSDKVLILITAVAVLFSVTDYTFRERQKGKKLSFSSFFSFLLCSQTFLQACTL